MNQNQISKNIGLILLTILVCLADLIIVGLSVVFGMWIDTIINTRPIITILMVMASVPISILVALRLVINQLVNKEKKRLSEN